MSKVYIEVVREEKKLSFNNIVMFFFSFLSTIFSICCSNSNRNNGYNNNKFQMGVYMIIIRIEKWHERVCVYKCVSLVSTSYTKIIQHIFHNVVVIYVTFMLYLYIVVAFIIMRINVCLCIFPYFIYNNMPLEILVLFYMCFAVASISVRGIY